MNFKIINGQVFDPETGVIRKRDIYIRGNVFDKEASDDAIAVDAKGCIVTSGLIDFHVHFFKGGTENGVSPDAYAFPCGITTAVDAGSAGAANYLLYRNTVMSYSEVRILNDLAIASGGQITDSYPENLNYRFFNKEKIKELFERYSDNLVGIKTRLSEEIIGREEAFESLKETIKIAEEVNAPVVVHITNPSIDLELLADTLRAGDVICHCYQGKGETVLDSDGRVRAGIKRAKQRGVLFDSSNGRSNYDLLVCQKAIADGLKPDIISCDINAGSFFLQPLHSLPRIMSKYLDLGLSVEEVLTAVTMAPAKAVRMPELASLAAGSAADLVIFKLKEKHTEYRDIAGHSFTGSRVFVPQMTIKGGRVMYCQSDFG